MIKQKQTYSLHCDICKAQFGILGKRVFDSEDEAVARAVNDYGWAVVSDNHGQRHYCANCKFEVIKTED